MTIIRYKINNQTGRELIADDWESAKALRQKTQEEELAQFNWWSAFAVITNNDGSITHAPIDNNGNPVEWDDNTASMLPYQDKT